MQQVRSAAILYLLLLFFSNCKKEHSNSGQTVYAVVQGNDNQVKYWENGNIKVVYKGGPLTTGEYIFVQGKDVYISGRENSRVKCWKNGTEIFSAANNNSRASGLYVSGQHVFFAGNENLEQAYFMPWYWDNGTMYPLTNERKQHLMTSGIFVDQGAVYLSGYETVLDEDPQRDIPFYWKNGNKVLLGTTPGRTTGIFVYNGDVYVSGYADNKPVFWKNGELNRLAVTDPFLSCYATGIFVEKGIVYVSGHEFRSTPDKYLIRPRYWKNGQLTVLSEQETGNFTNGIFVHNGDVYVYGYAFTKSPAGYYNIPKYWKNKKEVVLAAEGICSALFVQ
ncbi:hypothetical protein [Niabella drilacis]|uniref:Uncharacterized protein n=1 Tax=Niabella drilacis (strain DSM 25811 / CCM 8410 / CCUG 62505 / LMG 26954 / E90) TaxID=1285928 RepID=A0A1G6XL71_NIADE|nr:hypothetical protein [Niabella drilacis]SDD78761.1 hypothetical protein SAMN04487894_113111 [Niabella drilacis]